MSKLVLRGYAQPILGTDPEAFVSRNGKIIGSEKIMPEGGVIYRHGITVLNANESGENKVIMDGVQVELNPMPSYCREVLSANIQTCMLNLASRLKEKKYIDVKPDFSVLIEVDKDEFDSLSGECKRFGCMPSYNAYGEPKVANNVDPMEYRLRCAGGHIHLGVWNNDNGHPTKVSLKDVLTKNQDELIQLMDVIVGNTCVLLDRDPGNIERRKIYGRAGEYRKPKHGIEYRTLSNFWLRSYPLMSFATGMARFAVNIMANGDKHYKAIMSKVNTDDIRKAINENDFELAYKNFSKIEDILLEMAGDTMGNGNGDYAQFPLNIDNIEMFKYLVKVGIDKYFPKDKVMEHWQNRGGGYGWEKFLNITIKNEIYPPKEIENGKIYIGGSGGGGGVNGISGSNG